VALFAELGGDDGFGLGDDFVQSEMGGVEQDGVVGGFEGGVGAVAVALIAGTEFANHFFGLNLGGRVGVRLAHLAHLVVAAQAADFRGGVEEDLYVGVGEDDGADVAAFHDHATRGGQLLLQADHPGTDLGMDADPGGSVGDFRVAQPGSHIDSVEENEIALVGGLQMDGCLGGERKQRGYVVERDARGQRLEGEGAVHGAGFKIEQAVVLGEVPGDGAFARACRTINGDDGSAGDGGCRKDGLVNFLARHPRRLALAVRAGAALRPDLDFEAEEVLEVNFATGLALDLLACAATRLAAGLGACLAEPEKL